MNDIRISSSRLLENLAQEKPEVCDREAHPNYTVTFDLHTREAEMHCTVCNYHYIRSMTPLELDAVHEEVERTVAPYHLRG